MIDWRNPPEPPSARDVLTSASQGAVRSAYGANIDLSRGTLLGELVHAEVEMALATLGEFEGRA